MQPADSHDLIMNGIIVVVMPLIILANLRGAAPNSPLHTYLWREHPNLMRLMLVVLVWVTLFSVISLLAHKGVISAQLAETLSMVVGVPFIFLSVAMLVLSTICAVRVVRDWRAGRFSR